MKNDSKFCLVRLNKMDEQVKVLENIHATFREGGYHYININMLLQYLYCNKICEVKLIVVYSIIIQFPKILTIQNINAVFGDVSVSLLHGRIVFMSGYSEVPKR